jgi:mono/diheme cytochrome c family protein
VKRTTVNAILLAAVILMLPLQWLLQADPTRRNFEVLPDMAESVPHDAYAANALFADGKTLREPVPGTIIRGQMPLHYTASKEDAVRAGLELVSPVKGDRKALARGAFVYETYCNTCHGPEGKGDGPVAKRGYPAPPSLLAPRALALPDGQIFHIVTHGQANMPSYASQIERIDRWAAIEHVRKLQGVRR